MTESPAAIRSQRDALRAVVRALWEHPRGTADFPRADLDAAMVAAGMLAPVPMPRTGSIYHRLTMLGRDALGGSYPEGQGEADVKQTSDRARPSPDEIEAARSARGGWTAATLAQWGVPWPPPAGWRRRLEDEWQHAQREASRAPPRPPHSPEA